MNPHDAANRNNTLAAVLVGGGSRRMGRAKHTLQLPDGRSLLEHTIAVARNVVNDVVLVGDPGDADALGVAVWPDERPGDGPLAAAATACARSPQPWTLLLACDVPQLTASVLQAVLDAADGAHDIVVARGRNDATINPLAACYRTALADEMNAALDVGERRLLDFVQRCSLHVVTIDDPPSLASVNTPAEWQTYLGSL